MICAVFSGSGARLSRAPGFLHAVRLRQFVVWVCLLLAAPQALPAAAAAYVGVEEIWEQGDRSATVLPYGLSLLSDVRVPRQNQLRFLDRLEKRPLYVIRVRVRDKIFFRLMYGNFLNKEDAGKELEQIRESFPGAWLVKRSPEEMRELQRLLRTGRKSSRGTQRFTPPVATEESGGKVDIKLAGKLLDQARQKLIDADYDAVLRITRKLREIGAPAQVQKAIELAGIARERQRKFPQAMALYREFLSRYPDSDLAPRIRSRLDGLVTMREEPRQKLKKVEPKSASWRYFGTFSQYYRNDTLNQQGEGTEQTGSLLSTDLDVTARRKAEDSSLMLRFNGGVIRDFDGKTTDTRLSRAEARYASQQHDFEIIGGRQSRTISGIAGRFDGLVYLDSAYRDLEYSLFVGAPVHTTSDGLNGDQLFVGGGIKFSPKEHLNVESYLYNQQASGLNDRQALGAEWQYTVDKGFLFGTFEYDFFYSVVDHVSLVGNYRKDTRWTFNMNWDYRLTPALSTLNALQGQTETTLDELKQRLSEDEIYQLAEDRTARNQTLFFGTSYTMGLDRILSLNVSWSATDATVASGGVEANPASDEIQLSTDYSFKGWLNGDDYATWGLRLTDSDSSSVLSLQARSRLRSERGIYYTPRLRLDYRQSKTDDVRQWIVSPELKLSYKPRNNLNLEGSFGFEYSNFNLPELNDQTAYSLYLSYYYQF